jgi:uncharacterized protein YndB with AHSA1/START domain
MSEITITRVYGAPRELVWKAWTEPAQLARWWGRRGWNAVPSTILMDVRPGGAFHVNTVSEADGAELATSGVYREVVEFERLVLDGAGGALTTVTFTDLGDGRTEMSFHTTAPVGERAAGGLASAFDRLAEHLNTTKEPA